MNWTEIITIIIAIYGAILSTFNRITQWRNNMFRVNVKIKWGAMPQPSGDLGKAMIFLIATNPGQRVVTISSYGFIAPDNNNLFFPYRKTTLNFPYELTPGKSCEEIFMAGEFAKDLKHMGYTGEIELIGFYGDELDRTYKSKPWKFNIDNWAKGI